MWASLVAQSVKELPAMQETGAWSMGGEDLEERMATHFGIAWRIPWTEEPGGLQSMGSQSNEHIKKKKSKFYVLFCGILKGRF